MRLEKALARAAESEARKWSVRAMRAAGCPRVQAADAGRQMSPAMPALEHRSPPDDLVGAGGSYGQDLRRRRILYVGGRNRQVAHFGAVVERQNGEFLHHDGGQSENAARLDAMIRAADAVLCPIECVSHDACLRIKRICKRAAKPFVPLRSASLACFVEGLREVAA